MEKKADRLVSSGRKAFTLIELMVVVAIVAILIGGVFQLVSVVGAVNEKARTTSRMQRLQNAISGFYAEYGYYPPVPQYNVPDPWSSQLKDDFGQTVNTATEAGLAEACRLACANQPVSFEYPPAQRWDPFINEMFKNYQIRSPNEVLGGTAASITKESWSEVKMFKFGLLSYLLPRIEQIGFTGKTATDASEEPDPNFYNSRQWKNNNPASTATDYRSKLVAQQAIENRAVVRWLPNLENIVDNGKKLLGIDTRDPRSAGEERAYRVREITDSKGAVVDMLGYEYNGQSYALRMVTLLDGWTREFYYYSPAPYQSYRIWSAGPDGKTFPPWIPVNTLPSDDRARAVGWTKDDVVRFDR